MKSFYRWCPITGALWDFDYEQDACNFFKLAVTHQMSMDSIGRIVMSMMFGPEALNDDFDRQKELRLLGEEGKQDAELLRHFDLPPEELLAIWMRSRRQLQRLAEFFNFSPTRRERIEQFVAESETEMLAMLERHEHQPRKGNANGNE